MSQTTYTHIYGISTKTKEREREKINENEICHSIQRSFVPTDWFLHSPCVFGSWLYTTWYTPCQPCQRLAERNPSLTLFSHSMCVCVSFFSFFLVLFSFLWPKLLLVKWSCYHIGWRKNEFQLQHINKHKIKYNLHFILFPQWLAPSSCETFEKYRRKRTLEEKTHSAKSACGKWAKFEFAMMTCKTKETIEIVVLCAQHHWLSVEIPISHTTVISDHHKSIWNWKKCSTIVV